MQCLLLNYNEIKLDVNNRKIAGRPQNHSKLNNTLQITHKYKSKNSQDKVF